MIRFSPSILACDYMNMGKDIDRMEQANIRKVILRFIVWLIVGVNSL